MTAAPPRFMEVLDAIGWWGALLMVFVTVVYGLVLLVLSRSAPRKRAARRRAVLKAAETTEGSTQLARPRMVILIPCLNEAEVIVASVKALLASPAPDVHILVIDDGSEDGTADLVEGIGDPRVSVMRRVLPNARLGKGEALNAALDLVRQRYVTGSANDVRMQDMEFVIFIEVFQRGRRHLGSVGMGGNGQFVRLSALDALGPNPWSESLTEDFDLGIRLNASGWVNEFCREAAVHQQGVTHLGRLMRQRTRWFQGNLQAMSLYKSVVRGHRGRARTDTLFQILTPYLVLTASLLTVSFIIALGMSIYWAIQGVPQHWEWLILAYILAFGPAQAYGYIYWRIERVNKFSIFKAIGCSHIFVFYGMLGYIPGWWAVGRAVSNRTNWAKTAREAEEPQDAAAPAVAVGQVT